MSRICAGCGAAVSERYVRVLCPRGIRQPEACPGCEGRTRDRRGAREAACTQGRSEIERDLERGGGSR